MNGDGKVDTKDVEMAANKVKKDGLASVASKCSPSKCVVM